MAFTLLYGSSLAAVFVPVVAGASSGFWSYFWNDAYANTSDKVEPVATSSAMNLLAAEVSPATDQVSGSLNETIVADNALLAAVTPGSGGAIGGMDAKLSETKPDDISVYLVRKGDSITQIAEMFEVSVNTILWGNDLKKGEKLKEGDTLFILPVSGVKHEVEKGETLASIAKKYKVDMEVITGFNGLEKGAVLAIDDELVIPDAEMPNDDAPKTNSKTSGGSVYATGTFKDVKGYFINPLPGMKRRSQGLHGPGNRGVDLAAPTGTSIIAAASGTVLLAKQGYNGGYGNMVIVQHPNGTKTLYAPMSRLGTTTGAHVERGEVIGYVGSTGKSTGPHLHFEVFNAHNFMAD